jgi:hypothetical protein
MSRSCSGFARWRNRRRLDAAFVGTLGASAMKALRAHVEACADCRSIYDRLGLVNRSLGGMAPPVADTERRRRRWAIFIGLDVVAVAVALLIFLRPREHDRFRARGGPAKGYGVTLYCVEDGRVTGSVIALPPPAAPTLECKLSGALQVGYTTPSATTLTVTGQEGKRSYAYVPASDGEPAFATAAGAKDELVPWSTSFAGRHVVGTVDVTIKLGDAALAARLLLRLVP